MVGHGTLDPSIMVRIHVPQLENISTFPYCALFEIQIFTKI